MLQRILLAIKPINPDITDIHPEDHLRDDLALDSLDYLDLMLNLETAFNVKIQPDEIRPLRTVRDVTDLLTRKLS